MGSGRRRGIGHLALLLALGSVALCGCSGPPPMAFRITQAGALEIGSCTDLDDVVRVDVVLEQYNVPWNYDNDEIARAALVFAAHVALPDRSYIALDLSDFESPEGTLDSSDESWNRIRVGIVTDDFTIEDQVNRSQLVIDEWVWNREQIDGATRPCNDPTTVVPMG